MLKLINIYKDYKFKKKEHKVLKGINLFFNNTGFVSILGPSGCGKTTLLNLIGGLDKPTSGEIKINDTLITSFTQKELDGYRNSTIGFVFQGINLIPHLTAYENIEIAMQLNGLNKKQRKKSIFDTMDKLNIRKLCNKLPHQMSGGEMQRVAIARSIINNPLILLADEPTGSLDSKTSIDVMNILKELSKSYLVIMVTHNKELANEYSSRIIKIEDGNIIEDLFVNNETSTSEKIYIKKKTRMNFLMSISLSLRNLYTKWFRTILTSFAGSVGIIGIALVLSVSSGVKEYINKVQVDALKDYPVIIRSNTIISSRDVFHINRTEFPDTSDILVTNTITEYRHTSNMDKNFVEYIKNIDNDCYTILDLNRSINFNLYTKIDNDISQIYTSYFTEMIDNTEFFLTQYDCIAGEIPSKYDELALVIDRYNTIDAYTLDYLGFKYDEAKESYSFDEVLGKTYRVIDNDNYYINQDNRFYINGNTKEMYNNSTCDLTITAIIREKPNCSFPLYSTGILYTSDLTDYLLENAKNSKIVKEQMKYGMDKDVFYNREFKEVKGLSYEQSIEYQYENKLINYGAVSSVSRINIYSQSFEDRNYIENYVKEYQKTNNLKNISYSDYMSVVSKEFATFIEILTKVLIVFALISVIVSSIMISIITYISVLERSKEIGLLRSLGAGKVDIIKVFSAETAIIGFVSGILGVLFSFALRIPINNLVKNIIKNNLSFYTSPNGAEFVQFNWILLILLVFASIIITIIAGFIPAIIASSKQPAKALKYE